MHRTSFSHISLICFDALADALNLGGDPPADSPADSPADPPAAPAKGGKKVEFSTDQQDHLNKLLAEERRKEAEKNKKKLDELLASKNLAEGDRYKAEELREDMLKQLRTKEENARLEKKKLEDEYSTKLAEAERRAKDAEHKYIDAKVKRSLQDAAVAEDAFNPQIIVTVLNDMVKMVDEEPMINFPIRADDGAVEILQMTPADAVKKMKTLTTQYGGLFKSNIVSGVGGTSGVGGGSGAGKIDPGKVSMEEFMRLRKEQPERLGLPRK